MSETHRLGMFAKHWTPGKVKTRLAQTIGPDKAASVYKAFLDEQIRRYSEIDDTQIVFSPDDSESSFSELVTEHSAAGLHPQGEGDLGDRMHRFFERTFADGFQKATLVGSDTPTLPLSFLRQVDQLLNILSLIHI